MSTTEESVAPPVLMGLNMSPRNWTGWKKQLEEEMNGPRRGYVIESMLFNILDDTDRLGYESGRTELCSYLLGLADIANYPERERSDARYRLVKLLALKYFNYNPATTDRSAGLMFAKTRHGHRITWKYLSRKENHPDRDTAASEHVRKFVAHAYADSLRQDHRRLVMEPEVTGPAKAYVLQALIHTGQLHLVFEHADASPEMIQALKDFAMAATLDHPTQKTPKNIKEVLAFAWSHMRGHRLAASIAMSLETISGLRHSHAESMRKEAERLASPR